MANEEQVELLKQGVEVWNKWREENTEAEINLNAANLLNANLGGANLSEADLSEADLIAANLIAANLNRADLIAANLIQANLNGADLRRARFDGANLLEASLTLQRRFILLRHVEYYYDVSESKNRGKTGLFRRFKTS